MTPRRGDVSDNTSLWNAFCDAVTRHCRFLESEYGYRQVSRDPPFVIYRSDSIEVDMYYEPDRHPDLDLAIRKVNSDPSMGHSIHVEQLMRRVDGHVPEKQPWGPAWTENDVEVQVKCLAGLLKTYGADILRANERAFEDIDKAERAAIEALKERQRSRGKKKGV